MSVAADSRLDPAAVAAATLVCLEDLGPARLRAVLERWPDPVDALAAIRAGKGGVALCTERGVMHSSEQRRIARYWSQAARQLELAPELERRQTRVLIDGAPGYPITDDIPDRPAILLAEGATSDVLTRPRVAVVGTRSASVHGLNDARELGAFLAESGVTVVSGLAIGIDAAAHEGALDAGGGAVGVVATGLDIVYPRRHVGLFERVRRCGLLMSECGFGVRADRWRFPVRNRIIAALADVVVVVEATLRGGARISAEYALEYGRAVLAVPGSRRNPAAEGCNALLADGAHPLLQPSYVLDALGMSPGARRDWGGKPSRSPATGDAAVVLRACGGEAATSDQLISRAGLPPDRVAFALRDLEQQGWLERKRGWWWPR